MVCPKCGIIAKSGEVSCCGRSGSWFGNCGTFAHIKLQHTWYEGIQACKTLTLFKTAISRESNMTQQRNSSNGPDSAHSEAFITPSKTLVFASTKMAASMLVEIPSYPSVKESINKSASTLDIIISASTGMLVVNTSILNILKNAPAHTPRVIIQLCWTCALHALSSRL